MIKPSFRPLFFCVLLSVMAPPIANASACEHGDLPCASVNRFATLSGGKAKSQPLDSALMDAVKRYKDRFGMRPAATIIVPGGTVSTELTKKLRENGYDVILPWITQDERKLMLERSIRQQVEDQLQGQPQSIIDAAISSALRQAAASQKPTSSDRERSVIAHELGHKWFMHQFQRDGDDPAGHAYGGWAPDWLDEAVATSMENDALKNRRRDRFRQLSIDEQIPLTEFLTMDHPSATVARSLAHQTRSDLKTIEKSDLNGVTENMISESRTNSRVIMLTGEEADRFIAASGGDKVINFYATAVMFTDYLEARSGTVQILAEIAASMQDDTVDFDAWLSGNGHGLPASLVALEADWAEYAADIQSGP